MKALFLILSVALYWPLGSQIVFEEVITVPAGALRSINESGTGLQCAVTTEALFGKSVTSTTWMEREEDVTDIYELMYSPDGDLYTKNNDGILYSQDNGVTFTSIDIPNGIFSFDWAQIFVLDDDVLFISDNGQGHCYYSINNGQSWGWAGQLFLSQDPVVRLVNDFIYVADLSWFGSGILARINVHTGEREIVVMTILADPYTIIYSQILADGTVYMYGRNEGGSPVEDHLLQYRFGDVVESLGLFPNPIGPGSLYAVGSSLYTFGPNKAHVFDGFEFQPLNYVGLPEDGEKYFLLSQNDHVYAIVDEIHIFRSVGTLAYPGLINGKVNLDEDQACVPDTSGTGLAFWHVTIEGDNFYRKTSTGPDGKFRFNVPEGEYTVSAQSPGTGWAACTDAIQVVVDTNQPTATVDLLAQATANCANLSLDFSTPLLRRCFENYYTVHVRNTGPEASTGTTLVLHLDPFFVFQHATIPYHQLDATTVSFDLGVLELNADLTFNIFFTLSCQAELGMEHCLSGDITADNLCPGDRTFARECQANIGSFDPNDKRSFNESGRESDRVDKDEFITYHIRFQNTGTDTAFTVRIIDPLSSFLDLGTLEILSASHPYTYEITDGPLLVVDFKHILLPDSTTNESASHGFLKFRIKPLPSFDYGTTIPNKADIFFDYNDPVLTNEAVTVILPSTGVHEPREQIPFTVFPNPAKNKLELEIPETHRNLVDRWVISDSHGRLTAQGLYVDDQSVNITSLAPGAYTLFLISHRNVIGTKTFVKG